MKKKITIVFCSLALALTFVACASGGDGVPDTERTTEQTTEEVSEPSDSTIEGIDADKQISEFNEEEQATFCSYLGDALIELFTGTELREGMCLTMAASFAGFASEDEAEQIAACEESYEECTAEIDEEEDIDTSEMCPRAEELQGCEATMQEVHACLTATIASHEEQAAMITQYSCHELIADGKLQEVQDITEADVQPEECEILEEKCPLFY